MQKINKITQHFQVILVICYFGWALGMPDHTQRKLYDKPVASMIM